MFYIGSKCFFAQDIVVYMNAYVKLDAGDHFDRIPGRLIISYSFSYFSNSPSSVCNLPFNRVRSIFQSFIGRLKNTESPFRSRLTLPRLGWGCVEMTHASLNLLQKRKNSVNCKMKPQENPSPNPISNDIILFTNLVECKSSGKTGLVVFYSL